MVPFYFKNIGWGLWLRSCSLPASTLILRIALSSFIILLYSFNFCHVTDEVVFYIAVIRVAERYMMIGEALHDDRRSVA